VQKDLNSDKWYKDFYSRINISADPNSRAFNLIHNFLEKEFCDNDGLNFLEVGANRLEHLPFVKKGWSSYTAIDLHLPSKEIMQLALDNNVSFIQANVEKLPFTDNFFDRIISTCVLHHVSNPEVAIREMLRVCKPFGKIVILLPNDPGIMYRLIRHFTSVRRARKYGVAEELKIIHAREHRNHFLSLLSQVRAVTGNNVLSVKGWPFSKSIYDINLITKIIIYKKE
jgi:phosphatidylethanolamine/phosphatidyl-N-methylethanolamine N-methyltransferase